MDPGPRSAANGAALSAGRERLRSALHPCIRRPAKRRHPPGGETSRRSFACPVPLGLLGAYLPQSRCDTNVGMRVLSTNLCHPEPSATRGRTFRPAAADRSRSFNAIIPEAKTFTTRNPQPATHLRSEPHRHRPQERARGCRIKLVRLVVRLEILLVREVLDVELHPQMVVP